MTDNIYLVGGPLHGTTSYLPKFHMDLNTVEFLTPSFKKISLGEWKNPPEELKVETCRYWNTRLNTMIGNGSYTILVFV